MEREGEREQAGEEAERERSERSSLPTEHRECLEWGSVSRAWDHDLSWNQELDTQSAEHPCFFYFYFFTFYFVPFKIKLIFNACMYPLVVLFTLLCIWKVHVQVLYSFSILCICLFFVEFLYRVWLEILSHSIACLPIPYYVFHRTAVYYF